MSSSARKMDPGEPEGPTRKNLWVDKELHNRLKWRAMERGVPLQDLVEEYLQWALQTEPKGPRKGRP